MTSLCFNHLNGYSLLKTQLQLDQWFQSYDLLNGFQNNNKTEEIHSFICLYLKINIPNFWLIPLDRNTYCIFVSCVKFAWYKCQHPNWTNVENISPSNSASHTFYLKTSTDTQISNFWKNIGREMRLWITKQTFNLHYMWYAPTKPGQV